MSRTNTTETTLSDSQVKKFHEKGYLGPFQFRSQGEMAELRNQIEERLIEGEVTAEALSNGSLSQCRYLDDRTTYEICTDPAFVERMTDIYGEDLMLWRSNYFIKPSSGKEIPWHQDTHFWPIEPLVTISAWLAIDRTTKENGCLEIVPGSHKKLVDHIPTSDEVRFDSQADPEEFDQSRAVEVELEPGEFILFNERTVHRSTRNETTDRRLGLSIRMTPSTTYVAHDQVMLPETVSSHKCVQVSGSAHRNLNNYMQAAPDE